MIRPPVTSPHLSVVIPIRNESASIPELYRELTADAGALGPALRNPARRRRQHGRQLRAAGGHPGRRRAGARDPVPAELRPDRGVCRRLRPRARRPDRHLGRRPAERPGGHSRRWSRWWSRAPTSPRGWRKDRKDTFLTRRLPSMIANWIISRRHRRGAARLRLLAQGVPGRGGEAAAALRRDAPVPAGDRQRAGREDRRAGGEPPGAAARARRSTGWAAPSASCWT